VSAVLSSLLAVNLVQGLVTAGLVLAVLGALWLLLGPGPRRQRAYKQARQLLQQGAWQEALAVTRAQQNGGRLGPAWEGRLRNLEGECHRRAGAAALTEKRYEEAREHLEASARLLNLEAREGRDHVLGAMLEEARRLFSLQTAADTEAVQALIARVLLIQSPHAEASFWQGLCHVRQGDTELARAALRAAHEGATNELFDPPLYLGTLLLRQGSPQEAIRYLSEANRIGFTCPLVGWQLGTAILAAGGDATLAVRALERSLERFAALPRSEGESSSLWIHGFPEESSFVWRLAVRYPYSCPVFGGNVTAQRREAQLTLSLAYFRQGDFQQAADTCHRLLQESPPTVPVLRALGQALARLGQYEDAYKHLRAAYDQEDPRDPFTAGYLALCAARGKPTQAGSKAGNVSWALSLLAQLDLPGNAEWAALCSAVHAEARALGMAVPIADQVRLCSLLASVAATDRDAAAAYAQLATDAPDTLRPEYAWLYAQAAQQHGYSSERDLDLFARTFQDEPAAQAYFADHGWDLAEVEYTYLERCALRQLGRFPDVLGTDYPPRGEEFLLARSQRLEEAGQTDAALTAAEVLVQLAPQSLAAHDRLAALAYRRGDLERSAALLVQRQALAPTDPEPRVRRAVIEQQRGDMAAATQAIEEALQQARPGMRAAIAFVGARLALRESVRDGDTTRNGTAAQETRPGLVPSPALLLARRWLEECLKEDAGHEGALRLLAVVRSVTGDRPGLAAQAALMHGRGNGDALFHYLAACCYLAVGDYPQVLEAAGRAAAADPALTAESAYLAGWAHWHLHNPEAAVTALETVAQTPHSPSVDHARALLGRIGFVRGRYEDAIRWWHALDAPRRAEWKLDEPLRGTVFVSALLALEGGQYEQAAARFREAGRVGCRDRRLGTLLILALVKEGQRLLAAGDRHQPGEERQELFRAAVRVLDQALKAGCRDPRVAYLLALAHKRQGHQREAREALGKIGQPDANLFLQRGLLSLGENQLIQAEQEFAEAWRLDPRSYEACTNLLLTRLTLGRPAPAAELLSQAVELAADEESRRLWRLLEALLRQGQKPQSDASLEPLLAELTSADEQLLLRFLRGLGNVDVVCGFLHTLITTGARSLAVQDAGFEAVLVKGKLLLDRCDWTAATQVLLPLVREEHSTRQVQAALYNLLGCCACLAQDSEAGLTHFRTALKLAGLDPRIQQNLAVALEWLGQLAQAEPHWNRYFELLDHAAPAPSGQPDYSERLAYEALSRLATLHAEKGEWSSALTFGQRAQRLRPDDPEAAERLFHLYNQAGRPEEARRALSVLRQARPSDPQCDLYELDLIDVRSLQGIDRLLTHIDVLLKRYPEDGRVEGRAQALVATLIPRLERVYDQLADQLSRVASRVRHLPNYQVDWSAVHDMTRDLRSEFLKLKRIGIKCLPLIRDEEQRRQVRELNERADRKMDQCRSIGNRDR
jgi:Flp pilus assembly protein TadD